MIYLLFSELFIHYILIFGIVFMTIYVDILKYLKANNEVYKVATI